MKNAIICFTRVPKPGVTKTRLLPILTGEQCARLHWAFLQDLATVYTGVDAHLFVAFTPDPDWEKLKKIYPYAGFFPQKGNDLGEKMYRAIRKVLDLGYESVILTGTDLPAMTPAHLRSGFAALETADIAIGGTSDGGYYLIGMKNPHKAVFRVSGYGGATVYENTISAAEGAGLTVAPALSCDDVDTPEDLLSFAPTADPETFTGQCLSEFRKEGVKL